MTVNQNPYTGARLYQRDSQWASKYFGGKSMLNQPKRKFLFLVGFNVNESVVGQAYASELKQPNHVFLTKSFDPPQLDFDTEVLDQYNKKRIVQRRVNYRPVSLRLHDDVDNKLYQLLMTYYKYYYGDGFNAEQTNWSLDTYRLFNNEGQWGYRPAAEKYFFQNIWVAWINGGTVTYLQMQNPIISEIQFDNLDYADGGTPLEVTITFEYEGIIPKDINVPIEAQSRMGTDTVAVVRNLLSEAEEVGEPGQGPDPSIAVSGRDRSPGLGELFVAATTFYGKYNGKPTAEDALNDFVIRPAAGAASGAINSWGNFNFGGIGTAKGGTGLLGGIAGPVGDVFQYTNSGSIVYDVFEYGASQLGTSPTTSPLSDPTANNRFLTSTGAGEKLVK